MSPYCWSLLSVAFALAACAPPPVVAPTVARAAPPFDRAAATRDIEATLDDLHDAAAHADEPRYFAHFAKEAVFLGTDATERWDIPAFTAYARPVFAAGRGWTFHPTRRAISLTTDGAIAWFDEDLVGEKLGPARGSGVLRRDGGHYLVVQYNLALTVPNERFAAIHAILDPLGARAAAKKTYELAVTAATAGELDRARALLSGLVADAKTRPADDDEFWLHNQLTWIEWADGHLDAAIAEADASKVAVDHGTIAAPHARSLLLHHLWDRAYLLRERARAAHDEKKLVDAALAAKSAYDALAVAEHDDDGRNVLATFFAVRQGDGKSALAFAKNVDDAKDSDLQDLYVLALGYELAKELPKANALRERICSAKPYLMKPLLVHALAKEAHSCP